jgi:hypothetical protein
MPRSDFPPSYAPVNIAKVSATYNSITQQGTYMLKLLSFSQRIVHHQFDGDLAVESLIDCLHKLIDVLIGGKVSEFLWPIHTAVCNYRLPLDVAPADESVQELAEERSIVA